VSSKDSNHTGWGGLSDAAYQLRSHVPPGSEPLLKFP
jgi:hypothetical protein